MKYCPLCASPLVLRLLDELERLACSSPHCQFVHWDNPVPVVAALVQYGDQIILARNAQWPAAVFSLITGYLERDETPEQAVVRELQEELGLQGKIKKFIGHYSVLIKNQLILAYWVQAQGEIKLGKEIAEVKFLTNLELGHHDFGNLKITAQIVNDFLKGVSLPNIHNGVCVEAGGRGLSGAFQPKPRTLPPAPERTRLDLPIMGRDSLIPIETPPGVQTREGASHDRPQHASKISRCRPTHPRGHHRHVLCLVCRPC